MKLTTLFALFSIGTLLFTGCHIDGIVAKGDIVTDIRDVQDFHALDVSTYGEVEMRIDTGYYVEVQAQENIIDHLKTINENGTLHVSFDRNIWGADGVKIILYAPSWDGVDVSGSCQVNVLDEIEGQQLTLSVSGSGDIDFSNVDFHVIDATISGSGSISMPGTTETLLASVSGSGNLDALACTAKTANVSVSGSGNIRVHVTDELNATVSGSGNVEYTGDPVVHSNISGSGTVRKI